MARSRVIYDKTQIIDISFKIVNEEGPDALSIRRVSNELKVSSMTLYNYVRNIDEIKKEVIVAGFNLLLRSMYTSFNEHRQNNDEDSVISLCKSISLTIFRFAHENRGIYNIMHGDQGIKFRKDVEIRPMYEFVENLYSHIRIERGETEKYKMIFKILQCVINHLIYEDLSGIKHYTEEEFISYVLFYIERMLKE